MTKPLLTAGGVAMLLPLLMLGGCRTAEGDSSVMNEEAPPVKIGNSEKKAVDMSAVVAAQNRFGFALLSRLSKDTPNKNLFISPFSINQALMLAANGTGGTTQDALKKTLQMDGLAIGTANTQNAALREELTAAPKPQYGASPLQLVVANALWADKQITLSPSYVQTCRTFYGAEASTLDFTQAESASNTINGWASKNTKGRIPTIVSPGMFRTTPPVKAILTNAVYFKARWHSEFAKQSTRPAAFIQADGTVKQVPTMQKTASHSFGYFQGQGFTAARLNYDGPASLYVLLPDKGSTVPSLIGKLSEDNFKRWRSSWDTSVEMDLYLPRFKTEYQTDLIPPLGEMGMAPALSPNADFSLMGLKQGFIGSVIHKTYLDVNEEGTEAAAVTAVMVGAGAAAPPPQRKKVVFRVDRPFVLAVVDEQHGSVLFLGAIYAP